MIERRKHKLNFFLYELVDIYEETGFIEFLEFL